MGLPPLFLSHPICTILEEYPNSVISEASKVVDTICKSWSDDLTELTNLVNDWVPAGWEAVKDGILEPGSF